MVYPDVGDMTNCGAPIADADFIVTTSGPANYTSPQPEYNPYDTNHDCVISMAEMGHALDDWYAGSITMGEMGTVLDLWYLPSYC